MPPEVDPRGRPYRGVALAVLGVLVLSPDALIIRSIDESQGTIVFWRGVFVAASLTLVSTVLSRGDLVGAFRAVGRIGLVVAVFQAGAGMTFVLAITHTGVANVLAIVSTAPLFMAFFSRLFLGEAILKRTWLAITCVIVAVLVVFSGSLSPGEVLGDGLAVVCALSQAAASTAVRRGRAVSMMPALILAALLSASVGVVGGAQVPDGSQLGLMAFYGLVLAPTALASLTTAIRYLPAPEVGLITQLEIVLGPLWVWAVLGETPSSRTFLGGTVIVGTLTIHTILGLRASDGRDPPSQPKMLGAKPTWR